ncbi:alpha/beta hydrolase [Gordonia sp. X0973]|uniref:alpha/beta hydrolase n=1 Tax=Gordonia sp. X0973 TaxID=2742602 RepID=UPI000F5259CF|nr:alpha/beta hydrolase [Gordonia sp. X0973]QKT05997.1 alpha/beta hydrolase [Gordonia sp. X0973]
MSQSTNPPLPLAVRAQRALLRGVGKIPAPVTAPLRRIGTKNSAGDRIDPLVAVVGLAAATVPALDMYDEDPAVARRKLDMATAMTAPAFPPFEVDEDLVIDGPGGQIPATRYRATRESRGLVVLFHGGGWTIGSRASHDSMARNLAVDAGVDVLSVEYRLAPENPFPAAVDDALAAWHYAVDHAAQWGLDVHKIAVAGDSAGGNLAAVVAQQTRTGERGESPVVPAYQLLIYPAVDLAGHTPSYDEFATGRFLTRRHMDWFVDSYVPDEAQRKDPLASPLRAPDLSGLPPAHIVVAGFDPLRDEGLAYADALRASGVPVTVDRVGPMIHGFFGLTALSPVARESARRAAAAVAQALA